jgi:hypothetical protein
MQKVVDRPRKSSPDHGITSEIITITPDMAAAFLEKNTNNRTVARRAVDAYARDMMNGKWRLSGAAVTFDNQHNLIDGQHRLHACIKADTSFVSMVLYGVDPDAKDVIDTGRGRTAQDVLAMEGDRWVTQKVAVARWILALKSGDAHPFQGGGNRRWTMTEVLTVVRSHPMMGQSISYAYGTIGATISSLAAIHYLATNYMDVGTTANAFADVFKTGVPSKVGCPAHKCRERLIHSGPIVDRFSSADKCTALIHAWNMFAAGDTCEVFRIPKRADIKGLNVRKL